MNGIFILIIVAFDLAIIIKTHIELRAMMPKSFIITEMIEFVFAYWGSALLAFQFVIKTGNMYYFICMPIAFFVLMIILSNVINRPFFNHRYLFRIALRKYRRDRRLDREIREDIESEIETQNQLATKHH